MLSSIINAAVTVLGTVMLCVIGWVITITNRVSVLEANKDSLKELIVSQFEEVRRRLNNLEQKLDRRHDEISN